MLMMEEIGYGIYGNSVLYMLFLCKSKMIPNLNVSFLESQPFLPTHSSWLCPWPESTLQRSRQTHLSPFSSPSQLSPSPLSDPLSPGFSFSHWPDHHSPGSSVWQLPPKFIDLPRTEHSTLSMAAQPREEQGSVTSFSWYTISLLV